MTGQFSEIFVERAIQHLSQIGRSGDIYSEEHRDVLPKLQNLMKRNEFWSDRHWKPAYQELGTDELIVVLKGYALAEAYKLGSSGPWMGPRTRGNSVSPSTWMAAEIRARNVDLAREMMTWIQEIVGRVETGATGRLAFNEYMLEQLPSTGGRSPISSVESSS